jgi:hypothetical protein
MYSLSFHDFSYKFLDLIFNSYFSLFSSKIDESMRYEISLDWIAREQLQPGLILNELKQVNQEIEEARLRGQELRFLKEKRDILLLASYQFDMEINSLC